MNSIRKRNGIPDLRNGEHRILQKQIDMMHETLIEVRGDIKQYIGVAVEANTRSRMNSTLIKLLIPVAIALASGLGYMGFVIAMGG